MWPLFIIQINQIIDLNVVNVKNCKYIVHSKVRSFDVLDDRSLRYTVQVVATHFRYLFQKKKGL